MRTNISIIGVGEIGGTVLEDMSKLNRDNITAVDTNQDRLRELSDKYKISDIIRPSEVYIICVYKSEQVLQVLHNIKLLHQAGTYPKPLTIIESTIDYSKIDDLLEYQEEQELIAFPHRFNPNDPEHRCFNLHRVIGAVTETGMKRAIQFYERYINSTLLTPTTFQNAILCKSMENTYRFVEIAIAQSLALSHPNFEEVRKLCNTKWNIDIKEPRYGIYSKCLNKDLDFVRAIAKNPFLELAYTEDKKYKEKKG